MNDANTNIEELKKIVQNFCKARDWDQFHNAKELSIGAITEASELLEHFRFLSGEQIQEKMKNPQSRIEIGDELADVFFFLLRFCQVYDFDLSDCFREKIKKTGSKYPVKDFKGINTKAEKSIN